MPAVAVEGLAELELALKDIDLLLDKKLGSTLRAVAEPVRADAERLALAGIPRIGVPWSRMRVGITTQSVYVAPVQRGKKSRANPRLRRPKFADLLIEKAMDPAAVTAAKTVTAALTAVTADIERRWGGR